RRHRQCQARARVPGALVRNDGQRVDDSGPFPFRRVVAAQRRVDATAQRKNRRVSVGGLLHVGLRENEMFNVECSMLNVECETLRLISLHSTFNIEHSTFTIQHSKDRMTLLETRDRLTPGAASSALAEWHYSPSLEA